MSDTVRFENDRGLTLEGLIDGDGAKGVVLCSHFTGFKEYKHLHALAQTLADEGYTALRFDYSDCVGSSEGTCEDMAVSHQIRDTIAAIDVLRAEHGVEDIGLFGHSLGGLTAIAAAANDRNVDALVTASALANPDWDKVFQDKAEQWKEQGYITFPAWQQGDIKIDYGFYTDLQRYDATQLIKAVHAPILVLHAGEDELVDRKHADGIFENANDPKKLEVIEGADHMFSDEYEDELVASALTWYATHL